MHVAGAVVVQTRFLVKLLAVELVGCGIGAGGILLFYEHLTRGQILYMLHHLTGFISHTHRIAKMVVVVEKHSLTAAPLLRESRETDKPYSAK